MSGDAPAPVLRARARHALFTAAIATALVAVAIAAAFSVLGVRLFAIQTPSMGQTAPVGSLIVAHAQSRYDIGDIVTFTIDDRTITHRLVGSSGSTFTTKGDLNGSPDGWSLSPDAILGRAVAIAPGWGFALTAAPWLLVGAIITEAVSSLRRAQPWVWSVRLLGWSLSTTLISLILRPWFNVRLLDWRPAESGDGVVMHVVNTGILPLIADTTRLGSGQDAAVLTTTRLANGAYTLAPTPDPSWPVRLLLVAVCLLPFLVALLVRPPDMLSTTGLRPRPDRRAGRVVLPLSALTVLAVVVLVTVSTSMSAFAASIRNGTDTAGTNPFFSCRLAEAAVGAPSTWAAFALSGTGSLTEADFSGNGRTGVFEKPRTTTSSVGCVRDTPKASVTFDGSQCVYVAGSQRNPNTFSLEAWFQTSSTSNGRIIGFGDGASWSSEGRWDRLVYLDAAGRVVFGVFPGTSVTVASPAGSDYADGAWHHVVATLSSGGMALYVDGELVDSRTGYTTGQNYTGTWKIGCGRLTYWTNGRNIGVSDYNGPDHFTGRIQYAAIFTSALTAAQVRAHYFAGR
ncbi:LamG-like jellyroll fold domain-containing protein [Microbacterium enclense]|uniref:Peptidase S24-like n=1 Tax=Microbacterium enclense TaxID=993073 RepID=A0A1G6GPV9_9MICO|nr:LamG-like jellyroll fold domain-containing protein [Microbacterium enclense]KSU56436.1 hypothetical protein AS029_01430 [Microbacterium enclense]SDB83989.1 Peptidase S24-like [Microbacterium enclense]